MRGRTGRAFILVAILALAGASSALGTPPTPIEPVPQTAFVPIRIDELESATPEPLRPAVILDPWPTSTPTRVPVEQPEAKVAVVVKPKVTPRAKGAGNSGHSIRGKASWYCRAGRSVCHYKYPDRAGPDLYAAACGKLRRAMGRDWRGQRVGVIGNDRAVTVVLIDWCGSEDKTIDLYWDAMDHLGGTGVLNVTVTW